MNLDRIVFVGEGASDLQVIPVLVKRLIEELGGTVGEFRTHQMKHFRVPTFQKKVMAILNQEPTDRCSSW